MSASLSVGRELSVQFVLPYKREVRLIVVGEPSEPRGERPARVQASEPFLAEFAEWQRQLIRDASEGWYDPPDEEDVLVGQGDGVLVRLGHDDDAGYPIVYIYLASSRDQEGA